jgi:hypothetical protein
MCLHRNQDFAPKCVGFYEIEEYWGDEKNPSAVEYAPVPASAGLSLDN